MFLTCTLFFQVSIAPREKSWAEGKHSFSKICYEFDVCMGLFFFSKSVWEQMLVWQTEASVLGPSWLELVDYNILEGQCGKLSIFYTAAQIFSLFWGVFYVSWRYKNSVPKVCIFLWLLAKHYWSAFSSDHMMYCSSELVLSNGIFLHIAYFTIVYHNSNWSKWSMTVNRSKGKWETLEEMQEKGIKKLLKNL